MNTYNVAVVGAAGAVGSEIMSILEQRDFPINELVLFDSERYAGTESSFRGEGSVFQTLEEGVFEEIDIALFSAGASVSETFVPDAVKTGAVVIDNTSAFRMKADVPLVVPEVNPHAIDRHRGIIASPNCSTIQMVLALKPIHDAAKIKRIVVSTYQAVSGTGKSAVQELERQTLSIFNHKDVLCQIYPHQIAFNCLPHIDTFLENGYTREEMKMINETVKIMEDDGIRVTATTVRVPVFYGHSESVNIQTEKKISANEVRELLSNAPGIKVVDEPANNVYPLAIEAVGEDDTFVGRIREDESIENGINMWIVADNLRKGAALNAVQIAEILVKKEFQV